MIFLKRREPMKTPAVFCILFLLSMTLTTSAQQNPAPASKPVLPDWVQRSNENTRIVLESESEFGPEAAARQGVAGLDVASRDLKAGVLHGERSSEAHGVKQV